MESDNHSFQYTIHSDYATLSPADAELCGLALVSTHNAYAPYSQFYVGVAIRAADGSLATGSNQENGAFPVGQCGDRTALYQFIDRFGRIIIDTIAIVVKNEGQSTPASPCGSCRQLLMEYRMQQQSPIRLLLGVSGSQLVYEINDISDLLPLAFDGSFLGI